MIRKALILAAGKGTRMSSVTNDNSKEMIKVNNRPLIDYSIEEASEAGCADICVVVNSSKKDLIEHLNKEKERGANITLIFREPNGIIDAIMSAENFLNGEPFALFLPDMLSLKKPGAIQKLLGVFDSFGKPVIGLVKETEQIGRGAYAKARKLGENNKDIFIVEGISFSCPDKIRFFGRYVLPSKTFEYLRNLENAESEAGLLEIFIAREKLYGVLLEDGVFDAGNPEGYSSAKKFAGSS
jgi:UTP-glucose-1-phosphate uridylyltransferase